MTETDAPDTLVLDANGIIGTAKAGLLPLVRHLAAVVIVPTSVAAEVTDAVSRTALGEALADWLSAQDPTGASLALVPPLSSEPDRHVIALALDHPPALILSGDQAVVNRAEALGIGAIDAPTVVQVLAEAGLIAAARPHLDRMRDQGFGIPDELYQEILASVGE